MSGSGTTLIVAGTLGHEAVGYDTDPLALLIARAACRPVAAGTVLSAAHRVLSRAKLAAPHISIGKAYPQQCDKETKAFVRYWFDVGNRRQLAALACEISRVRNCRVRDLLWCALSRMIIVKQAGVSLAMDVAHSRPHRVYNRAPVRAFDRFLSSAKVVAQRAENNFCATNPKIRIRRGDARKLQIPDKSIDIVITSPPYLNAIDYLRGHKLSLVWMGYTITKLRDLRSVNIGTERGSEAMARRATVRSIMKAAPASRQLPQRLQAMLARYINDMDRVLFETSRVLVDRGRAVFVVGDSTIRGVYLQNSRIIAALAKRNSLALVSLRRRELPPNRRYLPPPENHLKGYLHGRMRTEAVMTFTKLPHIPLPSSPLI